MASDFVVARLVNDILAAEGSTLPPRQQGNTRVPTVTGLRLARAQDFGGEVELTIVWEDPEEQQVSHYNIQVTIAGSSLPAISAARSPATIRIPHRPGGGRAEIRVQTILKGGAISLISESPVVAGPIPTSPYSGELGFSVAAKTTTFTVGRHETAFLCDATAGAITANLPPAASSLGRVIVAKKVDASGNAVTLDGNGSETIDGATTLALPAQWDKATLVCDGAAWFRLA